MAPDAIWPLWLQMTVLRAGHGWQHGMMAGMSADLAELSSISSTLDQMTRRVSGMAEAAERAGEDDVAGELFAVERALDGAHRRLGRIVERGGGNRSGRGNGSGRGGRAR